MKQKLKSSLSRLAGAAILTSFLTAPTSAAGPAFSNLDVGTVTPGRGHIGLDIWWSDQSGKRYNPCHHSSDVYYGACVMSNVDQVSYYKVFNYRDGTNNHPLGMFIDNRNDNYCTSSAWCDPSHPNQIQHGWGQLVSGAAIEIYPYDDSGSYNPAQSQYGGVRIEVNDFDRSANSGRYSPAIGNIRLPKQGDAGTGKLNGFIKRAGKPINAGGATLDLFQNGSTLSTSTGVPVSGFSSVSVNPDGYYNLGVVPSGSYHLFVTDNATGKKIEFLQILISDRHERLDFDLTAPCFGLTGCVAQ
ncbi:hypothetical protein JAK38_06375 [Stenotrophomonas maltophilia]|nr:hypothetical protein [Stenotrophomonas maltophilia]